MIYSSRKNFLTSFKVSKALRLIFIACLMFCLLTIQVPSISCSEEFEEEEKPANPYKTKERIEEEDEFDSPELLDGEVEAPQVAPTYEEPKKAAKHSGKNFDSKADLIIDQDWKFLIFSIYEVLMIVFILCLC